MRRSTMVVLLFFLLVGGILGYNAFLRNQPPLTLTLAVDPSAQIWANRLVTAFNARNPQVSSGARVQFVLDATNTDISVWQGRANWTGDNHPEAWIATASWIPAAVPSNLTFITMEASLATSPLVWGGFESRVATFTSDSDDPFDWESVQALAAQERWSALGAPAEWGFVNIAIPWPRSSAAGVNAMATALGAFTESATPASSTFASGAFRGWFAPLKQAMRNSERLGESPASAMAARGAIIAAVGMAPEFEWLANLDNLARQETLVLAYPAYNAPLDFPLSFWQDSKTTEDERQAVRAFADFVLSASGQAITLQSGLRPLGVLPGASDSVFVRGQRYGIVLDASWVTLQPDRSGYEQLFRLMD